jgi:hypothetical protein
MFLQIVSVLGASLLLGAFFAISRGWIRAQDRVYGLMNLAGSLLLLWVAIVDLRWGFILLEVAWAGISIPAVVRPGKARQLPQP